MTDAKRQTVCLFAGALTLAERELVRFFRQRSRVVGVLATPLVFWLLAGSGLGQDYLRHLYPGTMAMILMFAAIFATISIIEDRNAGFLQGVLVSPAPTWAIVLGKVLGGTGVALVQGLFFLALAPWAGLRPGFGGFVAAVGMMALTAFALTSAGVLLAWRFESVQGFHGVINLVLMPLWILSGSVFRADRSNAWVGTVERLNPLSYGVSGMRRALAGEGPPLGLSAGLMAGFGLLVFLGAVAGATRSPRR